MASIPWRMRVRSIVASFARKRMIRQKDHFLQTAAHSCEDVQRTTLQRILALNQDSRHSQKSGLTTDLTIDRFRDRVPVCDYEYYRDAIDRVASGDTAALLGRRNPLLMFAVTSGTTAKSKLIPVTRRFVDDYRRGWQHWGMGAFQGHPRLSLSRIAQISSAHDRWRTEGGTPCGNISGLATSMQKRIVRRLYSIPAETVNIIDSASKQYAVATFALADGWLGMFITANPSTLLQLMDLANDNAESIVRDIHDGTLSISAESGLHSQLSRKLMAQPDRAARLEKIFADHGRFVPRDCWPGMCCLGLWSGGSASAYLPAIRELFGDVPIRDHGLHASEGRMTIPFEDGTPAGILDTESHFFEFIPYGEAESDSPPVLQAHELNVDDEYFILLTTSSGLYRYNMYDVVRCTGFHGTTPLLTFLHKGAHISSMTGEKITESQVVDAVSAACRNRSLPLKIYTVTPEWGEPPGYCLYVGSNTELLSQQQQLLAEEFDRELGKLNCEYFEKRETGRLQPMRCQSLPATAWQRFMANRLSASGGAPEQYKHPCLLPDSQFEGVFCALAEC